MRSRGRTRSSASQRLDIPLERAFAFFADATNLATVTPPWLRFTVLTPSPIEMHPGTLIDYRLRVRGIPLRWRTEIVAWEPPHRFVDVQLQGPYARWEHTHGFEADGREAVVMTDRVVYALPLGPLGSLAHSVFVRRDLEQLFDYRRDAIAAAARATRLTLPAEATAARPRRARAADSRRSRPGRRRTAARRSSR